MFTKLFRIGNEPEIRHIPSGKAVCELSLAYDVGYGQNKKTQWIKATLWDKKANALAPYLAKGNQLHAILDDVHVETWQQNTGKEGYTLRARVVDVSLVSGGAEQTATQNQPSRTQQQTPPPIPDFDDDLPPF
jgi:single-strand DNA-binding protein